MGQAGRESGQNGHRTVSGSPQKWTKFGPGLVENGQSASKMSVCASPLETVICPIGQKRTELVLLRWTVGGALRIEMD